jgi:hypothetical protein
VRAGDRHLESVLMLEAASEGGVSTAMSYLEPQKLRPYGAAPHLVKTPCSFRVLYTLHA